MGLKVDVTFPQSLVVSTVGVFPDVNTVGLAMVSGAIEGASTAGSLRITVTGHGLATGDHVRAYGVVGTPAANFENGVITVDDVDNFFVDGLFGDGKYESGGIWQSLDRVLVTPGQIMSADKATLYLLSEAQRIGFAEHLAYGVSRAANTLYYLVIGKNSEGADEIVMTDAASGEVNQHADATPLVSPAWLKWTFATDANANLIPFYAKGNLYYYLTPCLYDGNGKTTILDAAIAGSGWAAAVTCDGFVPPWAAPLLKMGQKNSEANNHLKWRPASDTSFADICGQNGWTNVPFTFPNLPIEFGNMYSQALTFIVSVAGYEV